MLRYYDERAPVYDDAYIRGTGTASLPDPAVFQREALILGEVVRRHVRGRLIDLACGTGYWLPHYIDHCSEVTLFDQSPSMLNEAAKRIASLGATDRCSVVRGDFFEHVFEPRAFDCALVGFFLSHLDDAQESRLFGALKQMLRSSGHFLILDSAWSPERARFNAKIEHQTRRLNDGTAFQVYKRYCDRPDISGWTDRYDVDTTVEHFGTAFFAVTGRFR